MDGMNNVHEHWMRLALEQAVLAEKDQEVPIGAVIVKDGVVIAVGRNRRESKHTALGHAEIEAIAAACQSLNRWRLSGCTLYVTLEPCPMCAGAIVNARIDQVVFGAYDRKAGACGSVIDLFSCPFNHHPVVKGGVLEAECRGLLQTFFAQLRQKGR